MEQLSSDQQSGLDKSVGFLAPLPGPRTLNRLKQEIGWENSPWSKYDYDPLLEAVLAAKLPLYAGDPVRETIRKVAKEGEGALTGEERARLALDQPLGPALDEVSAKEIEDSHCGMLPDKAIPNIAFAQRYRDAHLADVTLKAVGEHGSAILVAGNAHARTDRGVPWYIRQRAPDRKVVSVMLIEVEAGKTDPEAYVPRDPDGRPAADYIIFTPRAERPDPCAQLLEKAQ